MKYDVTIGIPVYMVECYIQRSLESALAQSYPSVEFLIVDDCGDDDSINIVRQIKDRSSRGDEIRILVQPKNMGVAAARNRIIDEAKGEFVFFMDSDDVVVPDAISLLMENARKYDADIVFGSYEKVDMSGSTEVHGYPEMHFLEQDSFAAFCYRKYGGIQASACNYIVKTSLLRNCSCRFVDADYWEDFAFTFDLVTKVSRAITIPYITYSYLCRENSLSHYQQRAAIPKSEVVSTIRVVEHLKATSSVLEDKPYFSSRCLCIMVADFYIACNILKRSSDIIPKFSSHEIMQLFAHPATFRQLMSFRQSFFKNFFFYILGKLPSCCGIGIVWCVGKVKKLL